MKSRRIAPIIRPISVSLITAPAMPLTRRDGGTRAQHREQHQRQASAKPAGCAAG
jgi:hypothetical protein